MAEGDLPWRIEGAIARAVLALEVDGLGDRVYSQLVPDEGAGYQWSRGETADVAFPAVILTSEGETEEKADGDTGTRGWVYPTRVWVADKAGQRQHGRKGMYLGWRKRIIDRFDDRPLDGVAEAVRCLVLPQVIFDPALPNYQHVISGVVVRVETQEARAE